TVDAAIDIPDRDLASLASLRAKLAELGGRVGGRIAVHGPLKTPAFDAKLRWHDYGTATGEPGETTLAASGTPTAIHAAIRQGAVAIDADVDRSNPDRIGVKATIAAPAGTPILPLLPKLIEAKLVTRELGTLRSDLHATVALARTPDGLVVDELAVTGALAVEQATVGIPK